MATRKNITTSAQPSAPYPTPGPLGDLLAVEGMLDLLRIAIEKDFAVGSFECKQESAAAICGHPMHLVHCARRNVAEALAAFAVRKR